MSGGCSVTLFVILVIGYGRGNSTCETEEMLVSVVQRFTAPFVTYVPNEEPDREESKIFYDLYTRRNPVNPETFRLYMENQPQMFRKLDPSKKTKILVHGWKTDGRMKLCTTFRKAYLRLYDVNFIMIDWGYASKKFYPLAQKKVPFVGSVVGDFIVELVKSEKVKVSDIHLLGFSLGAHVAGIAGRKVANLTGEQLPRLTGLDPAGPGFSLKDEWERLTTESAKFVVVIHTSILGFNENLGHVDIYPNKGGSQPGCAWNDMIGLCSHTRAYQYYAEALVHPKHFQATLCEHWAYFSKGKCDDQPTVYISEDLDPSEGMDAKKAYQEWAQSVYTNLVKTKTITREKYERIRNTLKGKISSNSDNSKFRFWMKTKGFVLRPNGELLVQSPTTGIGYKRVAVVEDFYDIIYMEHVGRGSKNGLHAGQKRTYRAVTESYAFLPREAVAKFLLSCVECQRRTEDTARPQHVPINLTTQNCVIKLTVPVESTWAASTPRRMTESSEEEIDISPISMDSIKHEVRGSSEAEDDDVNGASEENDNTQEAWNFGIKRSKDSPIHESSPHDETSSSGNKDDDDDDDEDDLKSSNDSERLKAFNMFVRLFVDENLERSVPISRQPKEKVQAIIDSCSRQFPEYGERARKRIRTYLKSCRRNKRARDSSWPDTARPTPAHLTSVQAEQILAAACENESHNAKRMRLGLEPVAQPMPNSVNLNLESRTEGFAPAVLTPISNNINNNNNKIEFNNNSSKNDTSTTTTSTRSPLNYMTSQSLFTPTGGLHPGFASPLAFTPTTNGPQDLSMKGSPSVRSSGTSTATTHNVLFPVQKLSSAEVTAVRSLIGGYRESAAFLLRSADELESLLLQQ